MIEVLQVEDPEIGLMNDGKHILKGLMANSPVDKNTKIMSQEHGTECLITDTKADYYLALSAKSKEEESQWQDSKPG